MRRTALAGVVALVGFWLFAGSFSGRRLPSHTATAALPALGVTVTAELFPLSDLTEFERRLTLSAEDGATLQVRMADLRGPADRMGLYRVGAGTEFAVLGAGDGKGDTGRFFAAAPLRRLDGPSGSSADWTCLGSFELAMVPNAGDPARGRAQVFAFIPAAPAEQVRPVPAAAEGVGRAALLERSAGGSCPLPGPAESGGGGGGKAPAQGS